ncbi:hypothetical protein [Roseibium denhamense]|nr:hypothetical protein [Roseibium denhamense]
MKRTILALSVCFALSSPALANECSTESVQQKTMEVATEMQSYAQQIPA